MLNVTIKDNNKGSKLLLFCLMPVYLQGHDLHKANFIYAFILSVLYKTGLDYFQLSGRKNSSLYLNNYHELD
jgi:hypothetical protein